MSKHDIDDLWDKMQDIIIDAIDNGQIETFGYKPNHRGVFKSINNKVIDDLRQLAKDFYTNSKYYHLHLSESHVTVREDAKLCVWKELLDRPGFYENENHMIEIDPEYVKERIAEIEKRIEGYKNEQNN